MIGHFLMNIALLAYWWTGIAGKSRAGRFRKPEWTRLSF